MVEDHDSDVIGIFCGIHSSPTNCFICGLVVGGCARLVPCHRVIKVAVGEPNMMSLWCGKR